MEANLFARASNEDERAARFDGLAVDLEKEDERSGRAALLLLDFQNEFASPGGKLYADIAGVATDNGMLEKVPKLLRAAR